MKRLLTRFLKEERGAALVLTLVLLLIGGLIIVPLLGFMGTGHLAGQVHEKRMDELYAADAGVEHAIWMIQNGKAVFGSDGWYHYSEPLTVNGKTVDVRILREDLDPTCREELRYRIVSTASYEGSSTEVDAYVSVQFMDFSGLLDYAIVSQDSIGISPNARVEGDVWLSDKAKPGKLDNKGTVTGQILDTSDGVSVSWPDPEGLARYYYNQVKHLTPATADVYSIPEGTSQSAPHIVQPLLAEPAKGRLTVTGTGWIRLGGTMYVKGSHKQDDLVINPNKTITLDLNGQTIFVDGGVKIGPKVTLTGSGCIIATGDIDFQPNCSGGSDDFVLVLSLSGEATLKPGGTFTGCIASGATGTQAHVQLMPDQQGGGQESEEVENYTVKWISAENKGLNFPIGATDIENLPPSIGLRVDSWRIHVGN